MLYSRLSSFVIILTLILTLGMFFYTQKGPTFFIPFIIVASIALILWLSVNSKNHSDKIITCFIFTNIGLVLLNMLRFLAGFASVGSTLFSSAFLFGGYFLLIRAPIGAYTAWFVFTWSIFQGFLQFYMGFVLRANYINYFYSGMSAGFMVLALGLSGIYFSFKRNTSLIVDVAAPSKRLINLWTAFSLNMAVLYSIIILSSQPYPTPDLILFWISLIAGIILWRNTTAFKSLDIYSVNLEAELICRSSSKLTILPLYILMLALYLLYTQETEIAQYEEHVAILFGINTPYPQIGFIKIVLMLFGAISLYKQKPIGNLIVLVACINIALTQPLAFFLFPLLEAVKNNYPFHYFPGMWTALLPMIPAVLILQKIFAKFFTGNHHE